MTMGSESAEVTRLKLGGSGRLVSGGAGSPLEEKEEEEESWRESGSSPTPPTNDALTTTGDRPAGSDDEDECAHGAPGALPPSAGATVGVGAGAAATRL